MSTEPLTVMSVKTGSLLELPTEIVITILSGLEYLSLLRCRSVCKYLHDVVEGTKLLTYRIELGISNQEDGISCGLAPSERLDLLKEHQRRWSELKWSEETRYPMPTAGLWELFGGVLAQQTNDRKHFSFIQLPSALRNISERTWTVKPDDGPKKIRDFGIDPSQDLLVIVEMPRWAGLNPDRCYRLHMKTMSTGSKHPLASKSPVIVHQQAHFDPGTTYIIQVSGDFLGVMFHTGFELAENELIIWEWRTGEKKLHLAGDELRSFCFMSPTHVVLTLFVLSEDEELFEPYLLVADFEQETNEKQAYSGVEHGVIYSLPSLLPDVAPMSFTIRSDPSPLWSPQSSLEVPFHTAANAKLFVVSLWIQAGLGGPIHLTLFAPQQTLLSQVDVPTTENTPIPWESWGPLGTRLMQVHTPNLSFSVWACYVFGNRYVVPEWGDRTSERYIMHVYDFNQNALRHGISQGNESSHTDVSVMQELELDTTFWVTAPTVFPAGHLFNQKVKTSLPYQARFLRCENVPRYCTSMCSEDALIVVNPEERWYKVFSF